MLEKYILLNYKPKKIIKICKNILVLLTCILIVLIINLKNIPKNNPYIEKKAIIKKIENNYYVKLNIKPKELESLFYKIIIINKKEYIYKISKIESEKNNKYKILLKIYKLPNQLKKNNNNLIIRLKKR